MKKYIISHDLIDAIIKYLSSKPYQEVFQGIAGLQSLPEYKEEEKKKEEHKHEG